MTKNKFAPFALVATLWILTTFGIIAQSQHHLYKSYIEQYKSVAQKHQAKYKIPASITLAQGLLESGAGQSALARKSNNHFGIKCHNDWAGKRTYAKDDIPNDCFRVYAKVEDSYNDHSLFLTQKPRYRGLFALQISDYRGWARGLQTAGYATDKAYANKLIKLVEDYQLYLFDTEHKKHDDKKHHYMGKPHTPYITHELLYVIARKGDTYDDIADEFNFKVKKLYKYNEVPKDFPLNEGDIVYFQRKNKEAKHPYFHHEVKVGESMHSISQLYGIRLKELYKLNKLNMDYIPEEGDMLRLRKQK